MELFFNFVTACVAQWLRLQHTSSRARVRPLSGPLINFIKWVLKYYLEVILYNCINNCINK